MIKMVLPPSRPAASECPPDIRSSWVQIPYNSNKKRPIAKAIRRFLAEDEGFEPPQTESESGVLPLHKSSIWWRQQDSNL